MNTNYLAAQRLQVKDVNTPLVDRIVNTYNKIMVEKGYILSMKDFKKFDRIIVPSTNSKSAFHTKILSDEQLKLHPKNARYIEYPFIPEGVITFNYIDSEMNDLARTWIYYKSEFEETDDSNIPEQINFEVQVYNVVNGFNTFICKFAVNAWYEDDEVFLTAKLNPLLLNPAYFDLIPLDELPFSKYDKDFFCRFKNDFQNKFSKSDSYRDEITFCQEIFTMMLDIFYSINVLLTYPNVDENNSSDNGNISKNSNSEKLTQTKKSSSRKPKKVINIGGVQIRRSDTDSKIKVRRGKVINRCTDVWSVRGHIRHYKSGKTTYVKPHKRGPGKEDGKARKKIYKVKNRENEYDENG